ncbi:cytosine permease [Salinibacterium amurskyense]|uniref:purine-cytosine permease family protein n=1 Tax=Salinibacterium amurskyense TaxID=205941 RepID=UPI00311DBF15
MSLYSRLSKHTQDQSDGGKPVKGTYSLLRIGMIWLAANLVVTTLLTGTLFVPGVDFATAFLMIVLGTLGGAIVLTAIGAIGTRTGLPTMAITRGAFGTRGSLLPVTANVIVLMGWSWVQAMLAGVTVNFLVENATGYSNPILFSVLCQSIVVILAILGHEGISKIEPWFAVLILGIIAWVFITAFTAFDLNDFQAVAPDENLGFTPIIVLDIVIATAISWTVLSADFNRFARTTKAGVIGSGLGYTVSTVVAMTLGLTAFVYVVLNGDEAAAFDPTTIVGAFGAPLAIIIFLSVMATNTMVVYGMVTSVVNAKVNSKAKFLPTALILGGISIIGSTWLQLLNQFTDFLVVIGAFFVPVFAIMIVDYYIVKRGAYTKDILEARGGRYWYKAGINWFAVAIWVIGAVMSYVWAYVWPLPIGATIPAFVLTFVLYLAVMLPERKRHEAVRSQHLADTTDADAADAAASTVA